MMIVRLLLVALSLIALSSCSSMNSNFKCNLTAKDSCMSMDEVNALTEKATVHLVRPAIRVQQGGVIRTKVRRVWISPYTDRNQIKHAGQWVTVPELTTTASA